MLGSPVIWWAAAVFTGVALVAIARRGGLAASATLALAGLAVVIACLVVIPNLLFAQQIEWKDPSPHTTRLVTVDDGVQLEVLDWGGSGPAIVLLAGLGATAHHYDDLAPALTARNRVIGVTRRGHRGSSAAPGGYGFARLAEDVLRVIDAVGVTNPVVIGHSFAGEEMHVGRPPRSPGPGSCRCSVRSWGRRRQRSLQCGGANGATPVLKPLT
jgi:hypothetical protein